MSSKLYEHCPICYSDFETVIVFTNAKRLNCKLNSDHYKITFLELDSHNKKIMSEYSQLAGHSIEYLVTRDSTRIYDSKDYTTLFFEVKGRMLINQYTLERIKNEFILK